MLFVFNDTRPRKFWMKNCKFPINLLFLNKDFRIIAKHYMVPEKGPNYRRYESISPAKYAIEFLGDEDFLNMLEIYDLVHVFNMRDADYMLPPVH